MCFRDISIFRCESAKRQMAFHGILPHTVQ